MSNRELNAAALRWNGPYRRYDLIKELCIALAVVGALTLAVAIVFSSPDEKPSTISQWSRQMPVDFVTTAVGELAGSSGAAGYGAPYNHKSDGRTSRSFVCRSGQASAAGDGWVSVPAGGYGLCRR